MEAKKQLHKVSAELLHLALQFVAKNDVRYYLGGVHIRKSPKGSIIEATNGHMCCILLDESGESGDKDVIIDQNIIKFLPKKGDVVVYDDESIAFTNLNQKTHFVQLYFEKALIDGVFPDINRVIPASKDLKQGIHHAGFNSAYIIKAINFFSKLNIGLSRMKGMLCYQKSDDASVALFTSNDGKIIVLVMPMRIEEKEKQFSVPSWLGGSK